jgi:hypothetical protein
MHHASGRHLLDILLPRWRATAKFGLEAIQCPTSIVETRARICKDVVSVVNKMDPLPGKARYNLGFGVARPQLFFFSTPLRLMTCL